ncbi:methyltransferase family protein [Nocardia tenerifensis]|uniref:Methyltransferase family protein n=1 Tax=Nocardia tenerifensis TaxID=228006 RepID=A0A318KC63_9NOCA|nr:class I SAM-dependent methyltransferase [Nocardia tenerifensis]PXX71716.1 methyltransferase family protein [Nocardia tenerifensis]
MAIPYALLYRVGFTPWERARPVLAGRLGALLRTEELAHPEGSSALDIGCGTGEYVLQLAERGWRSCGIDTAAPALRRARELAETRRLPVEFHRADVTDLRRTLPSAARRDYRLLLDIGCFHGLGARQRQRYGAEITALTQPGATMLLFAFAPGRRGPTPHGAGRIDLERHLPGWHVDEIGSTAESSVPGPHAADAAPQWYRLTRKP